MIVRSLVYLPNLSPPPPPKRDRFTEAVSTLGVVTDEAMLEGNLPNPSISITTDSASKDEVSQPPVDCVT